MSFTAQLTCLVITDCSISMEHLISIIFKIHTLRHLKLASRKKTLNSVVDIYNWEKFIRTELIFLNVFGLNEKHWFIVCEYILNISHSILLYTIPNTIIADYYA
jgi:hypothetical protein